MGDVSIGWVLLYLLIAVITVPAVSFLGPVAIREYGLESEYDDVTGKMNVIYRILSPALCSSILVLVCEALLSQLGLDEPTQRWLPSLFYWAILGIAKLLTRKDLIHPLAFLIEASCSVALASLLERFVVGGYLSLGIDVLDQSNFAFEMELALFYVAAQMVVTLATRHRYRVDIIRAFRKYGSSIASAVAYEDAPAGYSDGVLADTSEKQLFSYERRFGDLLTKRYSQDPLLRTIFFTIMAIEDSNRPEAWRFFERIACSLGVAKTTGIMQQQSDDPLSDNESVLLAVKYVEKMWDRYLETYAKSAECCSGNYLIVGRGWYEYDYSSLADTLERTFGNLYGDYCGTRFLDADWVFGQVRQFEERNIYDLLPKTVIASGTLFALETEWLSSHFASWIDAHTIRSVFRSGMSASKAALPNHYELVIEHADIEEVNHYCDALKSQDCFIEQVTFADRLIAIVKFSCEEKPSWEPIGSEYSYVSG